MKPMEILEQARVCNNNINSKLDSLERLYLLLKHVTRREDASPLVDKIRNLENKTNAQIDELIDLRETAGVIIATLPLEEQVVIEQYYINCLSWEKIAEKMHYSIRKIYNLRKNAVDIIESLSTPDAS